MKESKCYFQKRIETTTNWILMEMVKTECRLQKNENEFDKRLKIVLIRNDRKVINKIAQK